MELLKREAEGNLPRHVGLILDGNRRWARKRNLNINMGHLAGYETLKRILFYLLELEIKYVSIYSLSAENVKKRSKDELDYIYHLMIRAFQEVSKEPKIKEEKVRINFIGKLELVPASVRKKLERISAFTKNYDKYHINFCVVYDGQEEIVQAVKNIINDDIPAKKIDKDLFKNYLYTKDFPELDYLIRTGMEDGARISGFLLWDSSYAEFRFRNNYWPEYDKEMLIEDMKEYMRRKRRMGK
ncbi:MAG: di-trans,poly-cis-decaprenylcistransferase [Candidatus Lokiarchaeota archaeon]|nr:di-trans,poly-cis-decaprenylcistransferase [Candidatus Lokiarchaeota archaeon]